MDWRHTRELLNAAAKRYNEFKNLCVWSKTNAGMGSLYRSQHELVFVFKNGSAQHINNVELGRFGRNRSNVWNYAGLNTFGNDRDTELAMHPTVKPVAMVADAILDCSKRGGIVLDAFAGSGTTLIAAEKAGRRGYAMEIDPHYVDTTIRRFETVYGLKALHAESNLDFAAVSRQRSEKKMPRRAKRMLSTKRKTASQKVPAGDPPKHTQFRKGVSGNPKGRPKGAKNLRTLIMEAARDQVTATIGGKTRRISKIQATTMQLATKAAGGDQAAMGKFLDWIDEIETRAAAAKPTQFPLSAPDVEVLRAIYDRMKQCDPDRRED
jgi:hypothetical protein